MCKDTPESSEQLYHTPESERNYGVDLYKRSTLQNAIDDYRREGKAEQGERVAQNPGKRAVSIDASTSRKRRVKKTARGGFTMQFFPEAR